MGAGRHIALRKFDDDMRMNHRPLLILVLAVPAALTLLGCDESVKDPGCDLFMGSARVTGFARDVDGALVADASVEFTISDATRCRNDSREVVGEGVTDESGHYEVTLRSGNVVGPRCVFGRVAGSDSISSGRVDFTSDCRRTEPVNQIEMDLVATPSAVIHDDLEITLYRLHRWGQGPHYRVAVDVTGYVTYAGIESVLGTGRWLGELVIAVPLKADVGLCSERCKISREAVTNSIVNCCDMGAVSRPLRTINLVSLTTSGRLCNTR